MKKQTLPLQKLVIKQTGGKPKELSTVFLPDMLPYLGIEALEKDEIKQYADWHSTVHSTEQDIFVVRTGGRNGLVLKGKKGVVGSTLYCLSPLWIDRDFLYYFLKLNEFQSSSERDLMNTFWNIPVPIVSLEQQKQIVKDIEEALSIFEQQNKELELKLIQSLKSLVSIDSGILENIQSLDDFKKAVLDLAVSGKLTESWRSKNIKLNSAYNFLSSSEPKSESFYVEEDSKLPLNWCIASIGSIADCLDNFRKPLNQEERNKIKGTFPYCGANGIVDYINQYIFNDDLVFVVEDETFIGRSKPFSYIVKGKSWANNHVHVLKPINGIKVEYLNICLSYYNFIPLTQGVTGRRKLTKSALLNAHILVAPIQEQEEIINVLNNIFEYSNKLFQGYTIDKQYHQELQKSILSNVYKDLIFDGNIKDILSTVEVERDKKNIEISNLRNKQKQFRDSQSTLSKMEIIEILKSSNIPIQVNSLWEKSKYKGNIDAFYEALKHEFDNNSIKWELQQKDSDVPQSYIALT